MPLPPGKLSEIPSVSEKHQFCHISTYPLVDEPLDLCGGFDDGRSVSGDDQARNMVHASQIVPNSTKDDEEEKYQPSGSMVHESKSLWSPTSDHGKGKMFMIPII